MALDALDLLLRLAQRGECRIDGRRIADDEETRRLRRALFATAREQLQRMRGLQHDVVDPVMRLR
jgi:hypothetical protein